jgi:WD40 repeat protein
LKEINKIEVEEKKYGMLMTLHWIDENKLLSGYENGSILCFDIRNSSEIYQQYDYYNDPILKTETSNGKLIVGAINNLISIIDLNENKLLHKFEIKNKGISDISIKNDNRIIVTGGWDYKIRYFDIKKFKCLGIFEYHTKSINCLEFNSNNLVCVGSKDHKISIWDNEFKIKKKNKAI